MSGADAPHSTRLDENATTELRDAVRGDVVTPDDEVYDEVRHVWNGYVDRRPALVVRCRGAADVSAAVEFARANDLPLSVRGGGHHESGSAVAEDGLVVDLSRMDGVVVKPERKVAHVGPGCRAEDLLRETQLLGLATPTGSAGDVGVAGSTLGGAIGWIRRKHGLGVDALEAVEVVTPAGDLVTASAECNEDLFWAVRGGGGNFGVVTNFTFALYEVGPVVPSLGVFFESDDVEGIVRDYHALTREAPDEVTSMLIDLEVPDLPPIPDDVVGEDAVAVLGAYAGDVDEGMAAIAPFREIAEPILDLSEPMPYETLLDLGTMMYPHDRNYCHRSCFVADLDDDLVALVASARADAPSPLSSVGVWHLGGAVGRVDGDETAFPYRDAEYMITVEANWEDGHGTAEANLDWARRAEASFRDAGGYGRYAGFTGVEEVDGERWAAEVYGPNLPRLAAVKERFDPANELNRNVNVEPGD